MIKTLLSSFFLIFVAEMGDKTQLMSMALTARFKVSQIVLGISAAIILNNVIAVVAGGLISGLFPIGIIKTVSYALFIGFGIWTIYGGVHEDEKENSNKIFLTPFFTVFILFFISEFGDKTQIATMTLAMNQSPVCVLTGACIGMICANLIGIYAGVMIWENIPPYIIKLVSAGLFISIGLIGFWTALYSSFDIFYAVIIESILALFVFMIVLIIKRKKGNLR